MLKRLMTFGLVLFLGASLVIAQDQPQRNRQGGGGRGGFGGFGGGFGQRGGGGLLSLINNEAVHKELAVDADTIAKLKKVSDESGAESRKEMEGVFGQPGGGQDLSDEERRKRAQEGMAKMAEVRAKILAKYTPQLKEILSDEQFTRLQQIQWQSSLTGALADPEVIKALDITKEQTEKFAAVGKEYDEKQRALFAGGPGGGGREAFTKMQELNKERETKITDVLSAEQKEKFAKLKGKEFDVSKLRPQFGGGRGGPGGGRPATEEPKKEEPKKEEKKAE